MNVAGPRVFPSVLDEHFEELDFLWARRENDVFDPLLDVWDLAELEVRAHRHVEGLLIGGTHTVERAIAALEGDDETAATAAALALLAFDREDLDREVLSRLETASDEAVDGMGVALRHTSRPRLLGALTEITKASSPERAVVTAASVLAFQRHATAFDPAPLLGGDDDTVKALALESAGVWGGCLKLAHVEQALDDPSPVVQGAAFTAAAQAGLPEVRTLAVDRAASDEPSPVATAFLGVVGGADDLPLLRRALSGEEPIARAAVRALGALGAGEGLTDLVTALGTPTLLHAAGVSFLQLTGATDLEPDEAVPAPEGTDEDDWDEYPEIDPAKAIEWTRENGSRFTVGRVWQWGHDVTDGAGAAGFHRCSLASRRDVYLKARARRDPGTPDSELARAAIAQVEELARAGITREGMVDPPLS